MKLSFQAKIRIIVVIMIVILIAQSAFVIYKINQINIDKNLLEQNLLRDRIINTQCILVFVELILGIILFFYMPLILQKTLKPIKTVFSEISHGKFEITIPEQIKKGPISSLVHSTNVMINNLKAFDNAKKKKISGNRFQLIQIAENIDDGIIILNEKSEIVLANKHTQKLLKFTMDEDLPFLFDFHFEGDILKYFKEVTSNKTVIPARKIYFQKQKKHITFKNGIVHDNEGNICGIVITLTKIDLAKLYEKEESGDDEPKQKN